MNAYELAKQLEERHAPYEDDAANMLRQQADRIAELEKYVGFKDSGYDIIQLPQQTKPLSDEEIEQIAIRYYVGSRILPIQYARAIEERHGIK